MAAFIGIVKVAEELEGLDAAIRAAAARDPKEVMKLKLYPCALTGLGFVTALFAVYQGAAFLIMLLDSNLPQQEE
ncbi:MAG: hypothetical protein NZT92_15780 [Abditibacteriales bacterium]|nr:hypothetical protein [Abditibacteriales bacterium]MDW8364214.1 hypothetical protein [Abditibacteriales bacterium]